MLKETFYSDGKNNFKNNIFDSNEWSAPYMVSPDEIKNRVHSFNLPGRKIKNIKFTGLNYAYVRHWIEDDIYNRLSDLPEEERQFKSDYNNISPDILFDRRAMIDEPLLIMFEDNDIFEIDTPQCPEFRMSMNCIHFDIDAGTNLPNTHANILFSDCLDQTISKVEVKTYIADKDPMLYRSFNEEPFRKELVSEIVLHFESGTGLAIGPWFDYCIVQSINKDDNCNAIPFSELKKALFNMDDE